MAALNEVRERVVKMAEGLGHRLEWTKPWHGERLSQMIGTCERCGREAFILTLLGSSGMDYGGHALSDRCSGSRDQEN